MAPRLTTVPLEDVLSDEAILGHWRDLALHAPGASYFQTPDWVVSWWETIGQRPSGDVALVWDDSELIGLMALAATREPVTGRLPWRIRALSNAGSGLGADHAGWLGVDGAEPLLEEWLRGRGPMLLKGVPLSLGESIGGRLVESHVCPRLILAEADVSISGKLAKTLRNAERRLEREGVEFRWKEPGSVLPAHLGDLYRLNAMRRSETGGLPVFDDPLRRAFHERMLEWGDDHGGTAIVQAARGDEVVGVLYGFQWQDTFAYYQIGWDPAFRQSSLGSVLVMEAIARSDEKGLAIFDFLRGAEDYKYRFGATDVVEGSFTVGRSPGLALIRSARRLRRPSGSPAS